MAHQQMSHAGPTPIPTLEDTHKKVIGKLTNIEHFIQQHMMVGHLLKDPLVEASKLQYTMAHHVSIFKILWQAELTEARFENLRECVAIIDSEVRTKLRALELFMRLRKKQQYGHEKHDPPTTGPFQDDLVLH